MENYQIALKSLEDTVTGIYQKKQLRQEEKKKRDEIDKIADEDDDKKLQACFAAISQLERAYGLKSEIIPVNAIDVDSSSYVGYPDVDDWLEKIKFLESARNRIWKKSDLLLLVEKYESKRKADKVKESIGANINYLYKTKHLFKIQYGGSKLFTYYASNSSWFEKDMNNAYQLLDQFAPKKEELIKVKELDKISVSKIN